MDFGELLQLGGLAVLAVMLVMKDSKRDEFMQNLLTKMGETIEHNTSALIDLREEIRKGNKK